MFPLQWETSLKCSIYLARLDPENSIQFPEPSSFDVPSASCLSPYNIQNLDAASRFLDNLSNSLISTISGSAMVLTKAAIILFCAYNTDVFNSCSLLPSKFPPLCNSRVDNSYPSSHFL